MLKNLLLPVVFTAFSASAFGQATLTAANFNPVIGDAFAIKVYNGGSIISAGASGPNITWNFATSLVPATVDTGRAMSCFSVSPGCSAFPGSNLIITGPSVLAHGRNYIATSTAKLSQVGAYVSADTTLVFTDPADQLRFPFTYGAMFTDPFEGTLTLGSGIDARHAGNITVECDGYGTLMLPGRTDTGVLRVHSYHLFTDSVNAFGYPLLTYEIHSYDWYKPNYHSPLLTIQRLVSVTIPVPDQYFIAYNNVKVPPASVLNTSVSELQVFPNPASGAFNISYSTTAAQLVKISLLDIVGREVAVIQDKESMGNQLVSFDAGGYAKGMYMVRLQAGGETVTRKITIQ